MKIKLAYSKDAFDQAKQDAFMSSVAAVVASSHSVMMDALSISNIQSTRRSDSVSFDLMVKAESEAIAHGIKGILTAENLNARLAADGLCSGGMCVEFLEKAEVVELAKIPEDKSKGPCNGGCVAGAVLGSFFGCAFLAAAGCFMYKSGSNVSSKVDEDITSHQRENQTATSQSADLVLAQTHQDRQSEPTPGDAAPPELEPKTSQHKIDEIPSAEAGMREDAFELGIAATDAILADQRLETTTSKKAMEERLHGISQFRRLGPPASNVDSELVKSMIQEKPDLVESQAHPVSSTSIEDVRHRPSTQDRIEVLQIDFSQGVGHA